MSHKPIPQVPLFDYLRLMSRVTKTETCWLWTGYCEKDGHGTFRYLNKMFKVHRIAYCYHFKTDPGELLVCHECNVPACVNPDHLYLGTNFNNQQQCEQDRRRNRNGELNPGAKLRECDVHKIRSLKDSGLGFMEVRKQFMWIARSTVGNVYYGTAWETLV